MDEATRGGGGGVMHVELGVRRKCVETAALGAVGYTLAVRLLGGVAAVVLRCVLRCAVWGMFCVLCCGKRRQHVVYGMYASLLQGGAVTAVNWPAAGTCGAIRPTWPWQDRGVAAGEVAADGCHAALTVSGAGCRVPSCTSHHL